jgi:hypothetical protein
MAHQNEPLSVDDYPPDTLLTRGFTVQNATSQIEKSLLRARWRPGNKDPASLRIAILIFDQIKWWRVAPFFLRWRKGKL